MNRTELAAKLASNGVPAGMYSPRGQWTDLDYDGYLIIESGPNWIVQYFERGITRDLGRFSSESEACEYLFKLLTAPQMLRQLGNRAPPPKG